MLSLLDALEAIEWALILLRIGTEADMIARWRCLVSTKAQKLKQIKMYWSSDKEQSSTLAWDQVDHG